MSKCQTAGGQCLNVDSSRCGGSFVPGLCPGAANMQCCLPSAAAACRAPDGRSGMCIDTGTCAASGRTSIPRLCPGAANMQCCVAGGGGGGGAAPSGGGKLCGGGRIQPANNQELQPADLVNVQAPDSMGYGTKPMHRLAAAAYLELVQAARAAGHRAPLLAIVSGYRPDARQKQLWDAKVAQVQAAHPGWSSAQVYAESRKWVAPPGHSNHRSGRTMDVVILNSSGNVSSKRIAEMQASAVWKWMRDNAVRFGFYPYTAEPWHWEYNPPC